jgi:hypothetical protein
VTVEDDRTGAGLVDIVAESTACVVLVENKVATGAMRDDQFAGYVKGAARAWPNRRIVAVYLAPRAAHGQPHVDDARVALHEAGLEDPRIVLVPLGWDRLGEIIDAEGGGANSFARRGLHAVRALLASRRVTIAWTHTDFEAAAETFGPDAGRIVGRTLLWLTERGLPLVLGSGATGPLYLAFPGRGGAPLHRAVRVFTAASFEVMLRDLAKAAPFDDPERRRDLIRRFNAIPGARVIDETYATEHDSFYLMPAFLARPGALEAVLDTLGWVADEIQSGPAG